MKKINNKVLRVEYKIFAVGAYGALMTPQIAHDEDRLRALEEACTTRGTGEVVRVLKDKNNCGYFLIVDDKTGIFVEAYICNCKKL